MEGSAVRKMPRNKKRSTSILSSDTLGNTSMSCVKRNKHDKETRQPFLTMFVLYRNTVIDFYHFDKSNNKKETYQNANGKRFNFMLRG